MDDVPAWQRWSFRGRKSPIDGFLLCTDSIVEGFAQFARAIYYVVERKDGSYVSCGGEM